MNLNGRLSASYDNQILVFLSKYCEEGEGLWEYFGKAYQVYVMLARGQTLATTGDSHTRPMSSACFKSKLLAAGLRTDTEEKAGPNGGKVRSMRVLGIRCSVEMRKELERLPEENPVQVITTAAIGVNTSLPPPLLPSTASSVVSMPTPFTDITHVTIKDKVYKRELVSTIKLVRPFKLAKSEEYAVGVVTFSNPELKHQWLTQE